MDKFHAGDGAPRSLSDFRFSGFCWTRPFSFSDSSLVGLRPFSLPLFHPFRALCVVFVALRCHLRYWLGFYLKWQLMTTVSLLLTYRLLQLFTKLKAKFYQVQMAEHTCRKSLDSLSCLCFQLCSISQPLEQPLPSPSDV